MRLLLTLCSALTLLSAANPALLRAPWPAKWISHPSANREFGVYHFRKSFTLTAKPSSFLVHVTADNRYELFVNGTRVANGPSRGDLAHWRYRSLDLAPHLVEGRNVIAAVVWNWSRYAPAAQIYNQTGFLMQGDTEKEASVNTPAGWKCVADEAYAALDRHRSGYPAGVLAGAGEAIDANKYPWGWETPGYDDSAWVPAVVIGNGMPYGMRNDVDRWFLVPDTLPQQEETPQRLARVVRFEGAQVPNGFASGAAPAVIPANSKAVILLDNAFVTTAYPELMVSGGRGAKVELTYSEALYKPVAGERESRWPKGNRSETDGKVILGMADSYLSDGGAKRTWRPLWWRAYRYVQLDIQTGNEPLTIHDLAPRFTAYPFRHEALIETTDRGLAAIFEVGWRTARLCAHETYMDCPYFEQMQYVGDTRVQGLISLYMSGDERLLRNAIQQFDDSRNSDGITYSRYPSNVPQFIPTFSLLWINMVHDYWMHRDDAEFVRARLAGIRAVLSWFEDRRHPSGLAGAISWWPFVDWNPTWQHGNPPGAETGESVVVSLQWAGALRAAADLETALGDRMFAERYRARARAITDRVRAAAWNEKLGVLADTPEQKTFSRHANILAVLEDVVPAAKQKAFVEKLLDDQTLTPTTFYFRHYLARALLKAGLGERYISQLTPYREMLEQGFTTWPETPDEARSDCHAWSASPNYELLSTVAGVQPNEPGFRSVLIRPHLGPLPALRARVPHPRGAILVDFKRKGTVLTGIITLPEGVTGIFEHGGRKIPLKPGRNEVEPPSSAVQ